MKKNKKNLKALLASVLAAAMMLTACGGNTTEESKTPSSTPDSSVAASQDPVDSKYPSYLNLDGYKPIVKEGEKVTLRISIVKHPAVTNSYEDSWFAHFVEEKLNIDLEIEEIENAQQSEKKSLVLGSNDLPDIMLTYGFTPNEIVKYGIEEELLLPLSDYMSEELTPNMIAHFERSPEAKAGFTASDGKIYGLPQITASNDGYGTTIPELYRVFIDTRWMEAAGYDEVPDQLDEFVEMLRAFKDVKDEMGVDEVYPILSPYHYERVMFKAAFGWMGSSSGDDTAPVWDVQENKVVVPATQEKYQEYVKLMKMLYDEDLIYEDYFNQDVTQINALIAEGKAPVIGVDAPYSAFPDRFSDFVAVPPLKSEYNPEGLVTASKDYAVNSYFNVSADTEHPELCMRFLDYLCSGEGLTYFSFSAPAGSEDTLDMIDGWTLDEKQNLVYGDEAKDFSSGYGFRLHKLNMGWQYLTNDYIMQEYACEMVGEKFKGAVLDYENNGDHNYRYALMTACEGRLISSLPPAYMERESAIRYGDLKTAINTFVNSEFSKFVVGQRDISELPKFQEELKKYNTAAYIAICEEAYADYEGPEKIN
ncbi:MAG: hypothetical protein E7293_11855 [Lachnospiraceae bacterium]|nr:hypothetical protein [Lachnospiraceae bacterium]